MPTRKLKYEGETIAVGDRFRGQSRTRTGRPKEMVATVTGFDAGDRYSDGIPRADVRRNTSGRRQRIRVDRLLGSAYERI